MDCKHVEPLVSGYLDRELTQQESQQVRIHLETCEHCTKLHRDLKTLKEKMGQLSYPKSDSEMLDAMTRDLVSQTAQWSGWLLLVLGALVIFGFMAYTYLMTPEVDGWAKFVFIAFHLGMAILFLMVLRQRLATYKNDKYRKVKL